MKGKDIRYKDRMNVRGGIKVKKEKKKGLTEKSRITFKHRKCILFALAFFFHSPNPAAPCSPSPFFLNPTGILLWWLFFPNDIY